MLVLYHYYTLINGRWQLGHWVEKNVWNEHAAHLEYNCVLITYDTCTTESTVVGTAN